MLQFCEQGDLDAAKNCTHSPGEREDAFQKACEFGHLELAQWIYSLGGVDHHAYNEWAFVLACEIGHLEMVQWIYSLGGVDHHADDEWAFRNACLGGCLEVVQWVYSLGGVDHRAKKTMLSDLLAKTAI